MRLLSSLAFETWGTWTEMDKADQRLVQRLVGNTAALSATQVVRVGFNTLLSLLIARQLGAGGFGKYGILMAYLHIFHVLAMAGVPRLAIRRMAREADNQPDWFRRAVVSQGMTSAGSAVILVLLANLLNHPPDTTRALEVAAVSLLPFALVSAAEIAFRAREEMGLITLTETAATGVQALGSVVVLLTGGEIVALAWMVLLGQVAGAVTALVLSARRMLWESFFLDFRGAMRLCRQSLDFFFVSSSVALYSKLDVLLLAQIVSEEAVGLYNAAYLIVRVVNFVSVSYSDATYPVLSRLFSGAGARFEALLQKSILFGTTISLLVAVLLAAVAEPVIGLLYQDPEYAVSALLLRILAPFVVIFIWNALLSSGLMAGNLQHRSVVVSGVKLGLGLILYLTLTPWLGMQGTAIATVVAGLTGTALNYLFVSRELHPLDLAAVVGRPLLAGAGLIAALWLARSVPWPGLVAGGSLLYITLLIVFRVFSKEDFRLLGDALKPL